MTDDLQHDFALITAEIVCAYVTNNSIRPTDLPELITQVHGALTGLTEAPQPIKEAVEKPTPAQIRKSITPDALISFVDGKPYQTLKRHLTGQGMSLAEYRERYGLPADYPTVAPNYSARRSELAKSLGLGRPRRAQAAEPAPADKPKRAGRSRKVAEPA